VRKIYWLDADVYIQASNGPYKRVPQFWAFLAVQLELGNIRSPKIVYDEVSAGNDEVAKWFAHRKGKGLCVTASPEVQTKCYGMIADYVFEKFKSYQAEEFLRGGDGWVIAHAMDSNGKVVTQESLRKVEAKIKVPTICKALSVPCINTYDLLDELKFKS
jgi:hypothetical protein